MKNMNDMVKIKEGRTTEEVRTAMKKVEAGHGPEREKRAGMGRRWTFMAALVFLTGLLSLTLMMPGESYAVLAPCAFDDTVTPLTSGKLKTGVETRVLRFGTTSAANDPAATKVVVDMGGVVYGDVKSVKVYQGASNVLIGTVNDPVSMSGLSITLSGADADPGKISACPALTNPAAGVWTITVELYHNESIANFSLDFVGLGGSNDAGLPHETPAISVMLGNSARTVADVGLLAKLYNSITITWGDNNPTSNTYRVYRQREDQPGFIQIANAIYNGPYRDQSDNAIDCPGAAPDAPGGFLCELTKYAYIVNGYDNSNALDSAEGNTLITQTRSSNLFQIVGCGGCHTTPPDDALSGRGLPDGAVIGRHANPYHTGGVSAGDEACVMCHMANTLPSHRDKKVAMNTTNIFGQGTSFYDKNRNSTKEIGGIDNGFAQDNDPLLQADIPTGDTGVCTATYCHGSRASSPVWGSSSGKKQCNLCHGMGQGAIAWDTEMQNSPADEQVGAHNAHLHAPGTAFLNISSTNACSECHKVPTRHTDADHYNDAEPAEVTWANSFLATNGGVVTPVYNYGQNTCSNTYCHDGRNYKNNWSAAGQIEMPKWSNNLYLSNNISDPANCTNKCHGYPPNGAGHVAVSGGDTNCRGCHTHVDTTNFGFNTPKYYKHIDGIVTGLLCTGCHGQPPINNSTNSTTGILNANSTFGASNRIADFGQAQGAHQKHSGVINGFPTDAKLVCLVCHYGGGSTGEHLQGSSPDYISIGFNTSGVLAGWYQAPDYSSNPNYDVNASAAGTTVNYQVGSKRVCSSIYCHSNGSNYAGQYAYNFVDWDGAAIGSCESIRCHGNGSAYVTTDAHTKHINGTQYGFKCQMCHKDTVAPNNTVIGNHINATKNVVWNADTRVSGAAAYNKAGTDCANVYCHSDGKGTETSAGVEWNESPSCTMCHGGANGSLGDGGAGQALSTSHTLHTGATYSYGCGECHDTAQNNTTIRAGAFANHTDDQRQVKIPLTNDAGTAGTYTSNVCSNINCHGTRSMDWTVSTSTNNACTVCHGSVTAGADSFTNNAAPGALGTGYDTAGDWSSADAQIGAHDTHLRGLSQISNSSAVACGECHTVPATVKTAGHIDSELPAEVALAGPLAENGSDNPGGYDYVNRTCTAVYCHNETYFSTTNHLNGGTDTSPSWTNTSFLTGTGPFTVAECQKCHFHDGGNGCTSCHSHITPDGLGFGSVANRALHVNGQVNSSGGGCTTCHGQPPTSVVTMVNATESRGLTERGTKYGSTQWGSHGPHSIAPISLGCAGCHTGGQPTSGQHDSGTPTYVNMGVINASIYQAPAIGNTNYDLQAGGSTTVIQTGTEGTSPRTCSTSWCHGGSSPDWSANLSSRDRCTVCHGTKSVVADGGAAAIMRAPGGNGTGIDTDGQTAASDANVGAHDTHLRGLSGIANASLVQCSECHVVPAAVMTAGHIDNARPAELVFGAIARNAGDAGSTYNYGARTCSAVYCHAPETFVSTTNHSNGGGNLVPTWNDTVFLVNTTTFSGTNGECGKCHFYDGTDCSGCHNHITPNDLGFGSVANSAKHIDGVVQASGGCTNCHGQPPTSVVTMVNATESRGLTERGTKYGSTQWGSHGPHSIAPISLGCAGCHTGGQSTGGQHDSGTPTYVNMGVINASIYQAPAIGNTNYDLQAGGSTTVIQTGTEGTSPRTCSTSWCHGGSSPNWSANLSSRDRCTVCHGTKSVVADGGAAAIMRAPGGNGTGIDTDGQTAASDANVGAHDTHLRGLSGIANVSLVQCSECHVVPATVMTAGHIDNARPAELVFGAIARNAGDAGSTYNPGTRTCSAVYCHAPETFVSTANHTNGGGNLVPTWNNQNFLVNVTTGFSNGANGECGKCHFNDASNCATCHSHVANGGQSFTNKNLHMDGKVQASGGSCTGCHGSATGNVRAITTEFSGAAYGHHDSARGAPVDSDCCVCHMEGNTSDGSINTTYHGGSAGDGILDLRDPDTGNRISQTQSTSTGYARNVTTTVYNPATMLFEKAMVEEHCLKCHDSAGAGSTNARAPGGTATNPFAYGSAPAPWPEVSSHFTATNPSRHPVLGVIQGGGYTTTSTMVSPLDGGGNDRISCFDCHNATTELTSGTIAAHGGSVSLRAQYNIATTGTALCLECHVASVYMSGGIYHGGGSGVSAWDGAAAGGSRKDTGDMDASCLGCHGNNTYSITTIDMTAQERAQAAHGFNVAGEYAFLRGSRAGNSTGWNPAWTPGTCGTMTCQASSSYSMGTYSPGGTY